MAGTYYCYRMRTTSEVIAPTLNQVLIYTNYGATVQPGTDIPAEVSSLKIYQYDTVNDEKCHGNFFAGMGTVQGQFIGDNFDSSSPDIGR